MISAKVIKPHTPFKAQVFRDELRAETEKASKEIKADFEKTTRTWKHKPKFDVKTKSTNEQASVEVSTKDKIYKYVNDGTPRHKIPKHPMPRGKFLRFNSRFRAKTKSRVIGSGSGISSPPVRFAKQVEHPGTKAREFAQEIQAKWQPKLKTRVEQAILRAARKSGHSITK